MNYSTKKISMIISIIVSKFVCISHSLQNYIVLKIIVQKQVNFTKQDMATKMKSSQFFYRRKNITITKMVSSRK